MKLLETLFESIRITIYDVLATLIPGAVMISVADWSYPLQVAFWQKVLLAYVTGYAVQGIAALWIMLCRKLRPVTVKCKAWHVCSADFEHASKQKVEAVLGDYDDVAAYCMSVASSARPRYELFLALAEMARGFAVCTAVTGIVLWNLESRPSKWVFVALLGAFVGFVERYWRLHPLPNAIALTEYLARKSLTPESEDLTG